MIIERHALPLTERSDKIRDWLEDEDKRLGLITSIDGSQLVTLLLDTKDRRALCYETALASSHYHSLTPRMPLCHWHERICADMFGLIPEGHPRLKPTILQRPYAADFFPLRKIPQDSDAHGSEERLHEYLEVKGEGVYEIPVGPIHAGIIEPGHFRFSCLGEVILNLEIQLGYVHRGVEKRMTEIAWRKARFVAESAATDSMAAYALAFAQTIESMFATEPTLKGQRLRILALEIERVAMHVGDLIGFAADVGFLGVAASFSRLRGSVLRLADLLSGNRFLRGFIRPGGVTRDVSKENLQAIAELASILRDNLEPVVHLLLDNQAVFERMSGVGRVSRGIARNFGLVGVGGRACGIEYDARLWSPSMPDFQPIVEKSGDVLARAKVRTREIFASLSAIERLAQETSEDPPYLKVPETLPANAIGIAIVEGHRGELIHLAFTDDEGNISRYAMKDPSVNNWTALPIAIRNNLVADFPLCNKSFSLAYSGHDL